MSKLRNMTAIYIFDGEKVLLLYKTGSRLVSECWCGIGGHFEPYELNNPQACVLRELEEDTGINESDICNLKLRYVALRKKNGEIQQIYYFFAQLSNGNIKLQKCDEGRLEWVSVDSVLKLEMPLTAFHCLKHYFENDKENDTQYAGIATENGINFI